MLIRFPLLFTWNIIRNLLRFPFVLIGWILGLFCKDEPKYVRFRIQDGLVRWSQSHWLDYFRDEPEDLTVGEWKRVLEKLAKRDHCKGIVCEVQQLGASLTVIEDMRLFFEAFRKSGKRVVIVYKSHFGMAELVLGSAADVTLVQPSASVMIMAPALEGIYFSDLLKRFGVEMVMERVGAHKNAPERFTRPYPSPTGRADMEELLGIILSQLLPPLAAAQNTTPDELYARLADGIMSPEEALQAGLIDGIRYASRVEAYLQQESPSPFEYPEHPFAPDMPTTTKEIPESREATEVPAEAKGDEAKESQEVADVTEGVVAAEEPESQGGGAVENASATPSEVTDVVEEPAPKPGSTSYAKPSSSSAEAETSDGGDDDDDEPLIVEADEFDVEGRKWFRWTPIRRKSGIAVIPIVGAITDHGSASPMSGEEAVRDPIVEAIESARDNPRIKGAIAYINSRGGSGTASEAIWQALRELDAKKPVIAYLDDYAASGGYYIACGGRKMIASPWCVTGSIGVFGGKLVVEELLKRLRLGVVRVGDTPGSRLLSIFSHPTEYERQRFREQMEVFYERFVLRVCDNRKRPYDEIEPLAQGRVYVAEGALECGLIDEVGGFYDAAEQIRRLSGLPDDAPLKVLKTSSRSSVVERLRGLAMAKAPTQPSLWAGMEQPIAGLSQAMLQGAEPHFSEMMTILSMLSRGQITAWYDGHLRL